MTIMVTPYPIQPNGHAGMMPAFFSEHEPRRAVAEFCFNLKRGPFTIEEGGSHKNQKLWRARWVDPIITNAAGVTKRNRCAYEYRFITEPIRNEDSDYKTRWAARR